jgi:flagellar biosynthesis chaperone FliJ
MTERLQRRTARLTRIAKVGDTFARVAESVWAARLSALRAEQQRLSAVAHYCQDYAALSVEREAEARHIMAWRQSRDFSNWLAQLSVEQERKVAQAEFLVEAAAEEVAKKRGFARALNLIADKAASELRRQAANREQRELEALWRPAESSHLAS